MSQRRLTIRRETISALEPEELGSVVGAISAPALVCVVTSVQYSRCHTCGIACTSDCPQTS